MRSRQPTVRDSQVGNVAGRIASMLSQPNVEQVSVFRGPGGNYYVRPGRPDDHPAMPPLMGVYAGATTLEQLIEDMSEAGR